MELQMLGAVMLIAALALTWLRFDWAAVFLLAAVGALDMYLIKKKRMTISEWTRNLFPRSIDAVVLIVLLATTWYLGPPMFLPVMLGTIIGHCLWSEE